MVGRKPKPKALKELGGNPGGRKLNHAEPKFSKLKACPEWLPAEAKREWVRTVEELAALNMLQAVDTASLAGYCVSYARWKSAEAMVEAQGQTIEEPIVTKSGEVVGQRIRRHPATIIAKDERVLMQKFATLFGFDPSSRSRLHVAPEKEKSALDAILDGDTENDAAYVQ